MGEAMKDNYDKLLSEADALECLANAQIHVEKLRVSGTSIARRDARRILQDLECTVLTGKKHWGRQTISDLSDDDRKSVEDELGVLPHYLRAAECRIQSYVQNETTAFKLVNELKWTRKVMEQVGNTLKAKYPGLIEL